MKPWHQIVVPRSDLREGKPLDASEFAIHLHQVVAGNAPDDYKDAARFFQRTFLTSGLKDVAAEVARRLDGETVNASPVINLTTQFGGGKTHALALLYHLFTAGDAARQWTGVEEILGAATIRSVPRAAVATFVGSEFDAVAGKGEPGEPRRLTPWGDLAWQLGGAAAFETVRQQDELRVRPGGDVLRRFLPTDTPVLILMDEVLNFLNAARAIRAGDVGDRRSSLAAQFLQFVQTLTMEASSRTGLVLVMALPKSEQEMSAEDEADYARLQKLSARVDKPYVLAQGLETAEIIRRRLFEDIGDQRERDAVARGFAKWVAAERQLLPQWFPADQAKDMFGAAYPFHPTVFSVFERKWQTVPSFQRTRGVLRMLALWVSQSYRAAFERGQRDALITLGMAPLDDPYFRAAVLEQLGEQRLAGPILTDIAGPTANAARLDQAGANAIRTAHLHQATAAAILFESSGGQIREEATLPELRLDLGGPEIELGHIETALDALRDACHYIAVDGSRYRFSLRANLNKVLADLRATLDPSVVESRMRDAIQNVFKKGGTLERRFFPERSSDMPNAPTLALVVLGAEQSWANGEREKTQALIRSFISDAGSSSRTYKSALFFAVPESPTRLLEAAKTLVAWETLDGEADQRQLDDTERLQISKAIRQAERDQAEAVWQTYTRILFLGAEGALEEIHLGQLHSSAAESLPGYIEQRLRQQDLLVLSINPGFIARHWPSALPRWPLRSLRDAFFSSPIFPRLVDLGALRTAVARGVGEGAYGYAQLGEDGSISELRFEEAIAEGEVEFNDATALITKAEAAALKTAPPVPLPIKSSAGGADAGVLGDAVAGSGAPAPPTTVEGLRWSGDLVPAKWALFYSKVVARLVPGGGVRLNLSVEANPQSGLSRSQVDEVKQGLADLELSPPAVFTASPAALDEGLDAAALIQQGENASVEFKETARVNTHTRAVDHAIELAVVKTVAGFFNAAGGALVIGVNDSGEPVGLDRDIATLHERKTTDGYEQFLRTLLIKTIGKEECTRVVISFADVEETTVCVVRVPPAHKPAYVNEAGTKTLYVRFGNTTQPFDIEDAHNYMLRRFYR